jgi:N6-adenosine-specific RNA methylase IME4
MPDGWPTGRYAACVVDVPWDYGLTQRLGGKGRRPNSARAQYPTMTAAEAARLPVGDLLLPGGHLWAWIPSAGLLAGWHLGVLDAWHVRPVSLLTWCKAGQPGLGTYARATTEHVILAVNGWGGVPDTPAPATHFEAARPGGHSTKPAALGDLVEQLKPGGPWVELFARQQRLGWQSWGWGWRSPTPDGRPVPQVEQESAYLDGANGDLNDEVHGDAPVAVEGSTNGRKRSPSRAAS